MKIENMIKMIDEIKFVTTTNNYNAAKFVEAKILDLTLIDNYYLLKALKESTTESETVYFDFAELIKKDRDNSTFDFNNCIFYRILTELYNIKDNIKDDDNSDYLSFVEGAGNLDKYIEIVKENF